MRARRAVGAMAAAVGLSLLVGCGDDGGGALSHEDFIAAADAICAETDEALDALPEPTSDEEAADNFRAELEANEQQVEQLAALDVPAEDEEDVDRILELLGGVLDQAREALPAVESGDFEAANQLLAGVEADAAEAQQLAMELGLEVCGADG